MRGLAILALTNKGLSRQLLSTINRTLAVLVLAFHWNSAHAQSLSGLSDLILITGQSNVQGSGTAYDHTIDTVDLKVYAYTSNAYTGVTDWQVADLHQAWDVNGWHPGNGTLDPNVLPGTEPYNNFAFHFAKTVVENDPARSVGIIVASAPGKGIRHWDSASTFSQIVANKVNEALTAQGVKTRLSGILWHQGETDWQYHGTSDIDASDTEKQDPTYYPEKLSALIANFRAENWFGPRLPFICGETKRAPVNAHLMALNNDADPWTACVKAEDLSTKDNTHFDAAGLRALGQRYGLKYLEILATINNDNSAPATTISVPQTASPLPPDTQQLRGSATDTGGSGIDKIRIAVKNIQSDDWLDFHSGHFTAGFKTSFATLSNSTISSTDWHVDTQLTDGHYKLFALAIDNSGNFSKTVTGRKSYTTKTFTVNGDNQAPETTITNPPTHSSVSPLLSGQAIDNISGSGIDTVRVALKNRSSGEWLDFASQTFHPGFRFSFADLNATSASVTQWSLPTNLAEGQYRLFTLATDNAGNYAKTSTGARRYTVRTFVIEPLDTIAPETQIERPGSELLTPEITLSGSVTDAGGSGIDYVRVAIKQVGSNTWLNLTDNTFSPKFKHGKATLTNYTAVSSNWQLAASLPAGAYKLFAQGVDKAGNYRTSGSDSRLYRIMHFTVVDNP